MIGIAWVRRALTAGAAAGCLAAAGPVPPAASARRPGPALPDLVVDARSLRDHAVAAEGDRVLLRFPTVLSNVGECPVEVSGNREGGRMAAYQTLYRGAPGQAAPDSRIPIGEFRYHDEHGHWHLLQVALYRLLRADGVPVRTSGKVSFCLRDDRLLHPRLPGASRSGAYHECTVAREARTLKSGISVGWADVYPRSLPDQCLDVTGVPPGEYRLEVVANPDRLLLEKSLGNNTASCRVRLTRTAPQEFASRPAERPRGGS